MTAANLPDLDAIQDRAREFTRLQNGGGNYSELDTAAYRSQSDVPALLAYARDLEARVGRVEALADGWLEDYGPGSRAAEILGPQKVSIKFAVGKIRAALTATEGQA